MVVKTELCAFSEFRIYPGHGIKFIRKDGQPVNISSSKCKHMIEQRKKSAKLMWTQSWRRLHKKGKEEGAVKKKARKIVKAQRAIVGASIEELMKKKLAPKPKSEAAEAALKEIKERTKAGTKKSTSAAKTTHASTNANIPKVQKTPAFNARGGSKR